MVHTKALKPLGSLDYKCLLKEQQKQPDEYPFSYYGNHRTDAEQATAKAQLSIEALRVLTNCIWLQPPDVHLQDKLLMEKMVLRIMAEF